MLHPLPHTVGRLNIKTKGYGGGEEGQGDPTGPPRMGTTSHYLLLSWRCCSSWMTSAMPSSGTKA